MIADTLGETTTSARQAILQIVKVGGRNQARKFLNYSLQAEEHGGMMLPDGSRRRTPGGVFFHFAYTIGETKNGSPLRKVVLQKATKRHKKHFAQPANTQTTEKLLAPPLARTLTWENRIATVKEAEIEKGQMSTVKITVIGRPGKILDKGTCIVTVMESSKVPMLPKGLPTPTSTPTKYAVYIASKQWKKVEEAIKDPEDVLIIEGFPKTDPEVSAIAVFTTNVTTKKLQMAKRRPQAAP
jgi:hypothetical protein